MIKNKKNRQVLIFFKDGRFSLWTKCHLWHKWLSKTPRIYANSMAKTLGKKPDYGPCFWGMYEESPEEKGYTYVGVLDETTEPIL
jgi:hypothetical protein